MLCSSAAVPCRADHDRRFEDLLWLRRQDRAALYDLAKAHPSRSSPGAMS